VLVLVPESGDGIQTLKSGIMEIGDIFVVNKADRSGADKLRQEIEVTLGIRRGNAFRNVPAHHGVRADGRTAGRAGGRKGGRSEPGADENVESRQSPDLSASPSVRPPAWEQPVLLTSAAKNEGVPELVSALDKHYGYLQQSGELDQRRRRRLSDRTREVVDRATRKWIWEETRAEQLIDQRLDRVVAGELSPYDVAAEVLDGLKQGARI
jgi:LAO/AO transport system kinase